MEIRESRRERDERRTSAEAEAFFSQLTSPWLALKEIECNFRDSDCIFPYWVPDLPCFSRHWENALIPLIRFYEEPADPQRQAEKIFQLYDGEEEAAFCYFLRRHRISNEQLAIHLKNWLL